MERHFFLTTNGCQGRASFLEGEISKYHDVIRLLGYPRNVAAALMRECYAAAKQGHLKMNIVHNALDNSPEGIFFPELGTGVVNQPVYEPRFDMAALFESEALVACENCLNKATECFSQAKKIHDDWEKIYMNATDYNALNRLTEDSIAALIDGHKTAYRGTMYDRFFGAATINGSMDYIEMITEGCRRYFIKGRPGTGKSTFLKKLAQSAFDDGMTVERYHCAFDPNSLDMIIVRELNLCLFDSTAPHEYFPSRENDEIIDFYAAAVAKDTDEKYAAELSEIASKYKKNIGDAVKHLIAANEACKKTEDSYEKQISRDKLMEVRKTVLKRIFP
ncbi:MAG: hypothetical protein IKD21_02310 [Clostridia bacterium]|nr:hypothetical protein [Clostridia bacterium]